MKREKERPGVMLYFDSIRPALNRLSNEQCGALLRAILDYAEYGEAADLDAMAGMAFDMLRPKIDRDAERYEETRASRQYAVYCREVKKRGEQPVGPAEWRLRHHQMISNDSGRYPTTSTSPTLSPSASPTTSTSASPSASGKATGEGCKGEGEGEPQTLYAEWLSAMDEKNNSRAFEISNRLFGLGYRVDIQTRELVRRGS